MSSFCSRLITLFPEEAQGFHRGKIVEGKEHGLARGAVPVLRPRGHDEDVLLFPFEPLVADLRPAVTRGDLEDAAAGISLECAWRRNQFELRAHRGHDGPAGERVSIL